MTAEKDIWNQTKALMTPYQVKLGPSESFRYREDPTFLGFVLSRYKFAAKMSPRGVRLLELGCSEGIGATILGEACVSYLGIDENSVAIMAAQEKLSDEKFQFRCEPFIGRTYGEFGSIVSLNLIAPFEANILETIYNNLAEDGVCILGMPNIAADNPLQTAMNRYFYRVLPFGMNDEVLHTGLGISSQYLIYVGCHKKG